MACPFKFYGKETYENGYNSCLTVAQEAIRSDMYFA
jgi:hypothetical protein